MDVVQAPELHLAIHLMGGSFWTGGAVYLRNLMRGWQALEDPQLKLSVLTPAGTDASGAGHHDFGVDVGCLQLPEPPAVTPVVPVQRIQLGLKRRLGLLPETVHPLDTFLRLQHVDAIFSTSAFGPSLKTPLLGWIPDFQELHLPEMFSAEELDLRRQLNQQVAAQATRIVLSSMDARRDLERFAPADAAKARILSFVAGVPPDVYDAAPHRIAAEYHLPERFFYLPNQFWKHKNHGVVLEALAILRSRCPQAVVVCTGNTSDYRNPTYFSSLLAQVATQGLHSQFIMLGMIPHSHMFQLMRQSLAVLQPSRFEGWSTTVEEVKSLGKRLMLSDIPVHREQNPVAGTFFAPDDAPALATQMAQVYQDQRPGPDLALEAQARSQFPARLNRFGQTLVDIVREATQIPNSMQEQPSF